MPYYNNFLIAIPNIAHAKNHFLGNTYFYRVFDLDTNGVVDGDSIIINSMAEKVTLKGNPAKTYKVDIIGENGGNLDIIIQDLRIDCY